MSYSRLCFMSFLLLILLPDGCPFMHDHFHNLQPNLLQMRRHTVDDSENLSSSKNRIHSVAPNPELNYQIQSNLADQFNLNGRQQGVRTRVGVRQLR